MDEGVGLSGKASAHVVRDYHVISGYSTAPTVGLCLQYVCFVINPSYDPYLRVFTGWGQYPTQFYLLSHEAGVHAARRCVFCCLHNVLE